MNKKTLVSIWIISCAILIFIWISIFFTNNSWNNISKDNKLIKKVEIVNKEWEWGKINKEVELDTLKNKTVTNTVIKKNDDNIDNKKVSLPEDIQYIKLDKILDTKSDKELINILKTISNEK